IGISEEQSKSRLSRLEKCWEEFKAVINELRLIDDAKNSSTNEQLLDDVDERCIDIGDMIRAKTIKQCRPTVDVKQNPSDYDEWLPFRDMYEANIHNNQKLAPVHKIAYLKHSLRGEAARLVNSFPSTGASYIPAWNALVERYSNEYVLKKRYINSLLQYPRLKSSSKNELQTLVDAFERNIKLLKQLGEKTDQWGMLIIQILLNKLDEKTHHDWEKHVEELMKKEEQHTIDDRMKFLHAQPRVSDAIAEDRSPSNRAKKATDHHWAMKVSSKVPTCACCGEQHPLYSCATFQERSVDERHQLVSEKRLCRNCLFPGHLSIACKMRLRCNKCNKKHHVLLHKEPVNEIVAPLPSINAATIRAKDHVFLSTAFVMIRSSSGKWKEARALIDNGAQVNLMTEKLCKTLRLSTKGHSQELIGVGKCTVQLIQRHWKRWKTEYLCELHNSTQRIPAQQRVAVGKMVILKEDNSTPCDWPIARIQMVHPGQDGVVRVVTIRTSQGLFKRPVSRICLLPFEREDTLKEIV
uniref:DUF5641 domain-containing protein n=1 Tax=Anopheles dirus TaxID=7168 RepID=A0A182NMY3_9DIPT